jgi:uncharacterized protein (TIGR02466 family)
MDYDIFNSMIWKSKINYKRKNELIENLIKDYNENKNNVTPNWNCLVYSSFGNRENGKIPEDLLDIIQKKIIEFLEDCPNELKIGSTYILSEIWYNIYDKNHFQEPHTHRRSLFSGCYYLKLNKDIHHQTTFYNPNFDLDYSKLEDNPYFCFSPDCEEGDLIIFPSNLKHGTKGLKKICSDELRITISFNVRDPNICLDLDDWRNQSKSKGISYK